MLESLPHLATLIHSLTHLRHSLHTAHDEMTSSSIFELAIETVEHLRLKLPPQLAQPRVGIICGSGLGGLAEMVNGRPGGEGGSGSGGGSAREGEYMEWEYKDVPNFPVSTVPGHEGKLIFSTMGEHRVPVVLLKGRAQYVATQLQKNKPSHQIIRSYISSSLNLASTKATTWTS